MKVIVSNPIRVELLRPNRKLGFWQRLTAPSIWRVLEDVEVRIGEGDHQHIVRVPANLLTDFASVPRPVKWLFPDAMCYGVGPLVHDQLYKSGEVGKRIADAMLAGLLVDCDGASEWQAEIFFLAVHLFGFVAWRSHRRAA